jgi:hypothetical protein
MGSSPATGEKLLRPLPLPPETRYGRRAADLSARRSLRPFFGAVLDAICSWNIQIEGCGCELRSEMGDEF